MPVLALFPAQADPQRRLAELRRRITRTAQGAGPDARDRADLDDQSILPLAHRRQDVVNQVERPRQVDGDHLVPVGRRERLQAAVSDVGAGIADQDVDRAERSEHAARPSPSTASRSATSQATASAVSRPSSSSARVCSSFLSSRPIRPAAVPARRASCAIPLPIPLPAPVIRAVFNVAAKAHLLRCQISVPYRQNRKPQRLPSPGRQRGTSTARIVTLAARRCDVHAVRKPGGSRFQNLWPPSSQRPAGARDQLRSSRAAAHRAARRRNLHGEAARGIDQSRRLKVARLGCRVPDVNLAHARRSGLVTCRSRRPGAHGLEQRSEICSGAAMAACSAGRH